MTTWLILGDEHIQSMYSYLRTALVGQIGDVVGSNDSDYKQWATCAGQPCQNQSRTATEIFVDDVKPSVVLVALGSNPVTSSLPANFEDHVRTIKTIASKYGAQVILVGPFVGDSDGKRLAVLRKVVPDAVSGLGLAQGLRKSGNKFTQESYKTLAERLAATALSIYNNRTGKPPTGVTITPVPNTVPTHVGPILNNLPTTTTSVGKYTVPLLAVGMVVCTLLLVTYARRRRRLATVLRDTIADLRGKITEQKAEPARIMGEGCVRFSTTGELWILNRREGGFSSFGFRCESWDELFRRFDVRVTSSGTDEHGAYWTVVSTKGPRS